LGEERLIRRAARTARERGEPAHAPFHTSAARRKWWGEGVKASAEGPSSGRPAYAGGAAADWRCLRTRLWLRLCLRLRALLARGLTVVCRRVLSPRQPKRALSAFMCFSKEMRPKVIAETPGLAFGDVGKQIGELWRNLSEEDKEPYNKMSAADKERYTEAMESYEPAKAEKKSSRK
jgi:hypothetical protein